MAPDPPILCTYCWPFQGVNMWTAQITTNENYFGPKINGVQQRINVNKNRLSLSFLALCECHNRNRSSSSGSSSFNNTFKDTHGQHICAYYPMMKWNFRISLAKTCNALDTLSMNKLVYGLFELFRAPNIVITVIFQWPNPWDKTFLVRQLDARADAHSLTYFPSVSSVVVYLTLLSL